MKYEFINKSHCYCITLSRASNAILSFYDEGLKKAGITTKQFSLLMNLSRMGEASTGELANYVNLERSTLTRNLRTLETKGWIDDLAQEGSRNHRYILTENGQTQIEKTKPIWEATQQALMDFLGETEMNHLMQSLHRLQELQQK